MLATVLYQMELVGNLLRLWTGTLYCSGVGRRTVPGYDGRMLVLAERLRYIGLISAGHYLKGKMGVCIYYECPVFATFTCRKVINTQVPV